MAFVRWVAALTLGVLTASSAMADSLSLDSGAKSANPPINLNATIPAAKGTDPAQSAPDVDATVNDLESSRAAIDHRTGPAITLGVSGWVGEQVIGVSH